MLPGSYPQSAVCSLGGLGQVRQDVKNFKGPDLERFRPFIQVKEPAVMLSTLSEVNPALRKTIFSRSVSESFSQTIRI